MTTRQEKVQEFLKEEVSEIIRREIKDPRLGFVTVTDTEVSGDLRHAKVFVSVMGSDEERSENLQILRKAEKFIRQALSKRMQMKVVPEVRFHLDTSADHGTRIFELLEQIKKDEQEQS